MCHMQWPLTFPFVFKVIWLWNCLFYGLYSHVAQIQPWRGRCVMYHFQANKSMVKVIQVVQIFAVGAGCSWSLIYNFQLFLLVLWQLISSFQDPRLAGSKAKFGTSPDIVKKTKKKNHKNILCNYDECQIIMAVWHAMKETSVCGEWQ